MKFLKLWMTGALLAILSSFSSYSFALAVCDGVQAVQSGANLNVRSDHSTAASVIATVPTGSLGSIQTGPATQDGYTWWYVHWAEGPSGWSAQAGISPPETFLALVTPPSLIYGDDITYGWCLNPWANTSVTIQATPSRLNFFSLKTVTTAPWARLYLKTNGKNTAGFNSLRFSVQSNSSNGQILYVGLYNTSGSVIHYVNVWDYVQNGNLSPNTWYDVRIPIADLQAANQTIGGFVIESGQAATFYVDDVALDTASGSTKWIPPTSTVTGVSVSCSPNSIQTSQTSQCSASVSGTGSYSSAVTWTANAGSVNSAGLFTAGSANALVTATSIQDASKSGSANVTVTTPPPPTMSQAGAIVYGETTGWGWFSGGWANTAVNLSSPVAYSGQSGIEVKTSAQWGRLQLITQSGFEFNTAGVDTLSFFLNIGKRESEDLYVALLDANALPLQYIALNNVLYVEHGAFNQYLWTYVKIPLSVLGGTNRKVYGVEFQSSNPATFYLDEVKFESNGGCQ